MLTAEPVTPAEFQESLEDILTRELRIWQPALASETMRAFDVGCFPWHGYVELSFQTMDESPVVTRSDAYARIAEWRLYNFASKRDSSPRKQREHLGARMKRSWLHSQDKKAATESFLQAIVLALKSQAIDAELQNFQRSADFVVTVFDPDDHGRGNLLAKC